MSHIKCGPVSSPGNQQWNIMISSAYWERDEKIAVPITTQGKILLMMPLAHKIAFSLTHELICIRARGSLSRRLSPKLALLTMSGRIVLQTGCNDRR